MNLFTTLTENNVVTVRTLINKHNNMSLKKEMLNTGIASTFPELQKMRDEILVWDGDGNVVVVPVKNGIWFQPVKARQPFSHEEGTTLICSLKETRMIHHNPISTIRRADGITAQQVENNFLYFYRATHPDTQPFLKLAPLWLAIPEFQSLLSQFPEGEYSGLNSITEVREPACDITVRVPYVFRPLAPVPEFPSGIARIA